MEGKKDLNVKGDGGESAGTTETAAPAPEPVKKPVAVKPASPWKTLHEDKAQETKVLVVENYGCLVHVSTGDGEALTWVPGAKVGTDETGNPVLRRA